MTRQTKDRRRMFVTAVAVCLYAHLAGAAEAEERFNLVVSDSPRFNSTAVISNTGLSIVDAKGKRFDYERRPRLDSPDGQFLGYYSAAARQYIRWPKSGSGSMYIGVVDGRSVAWKQSQMRVSAVGRVGVDPVGRGAPVGPMHLDVNSDRSGNLTIAQIDDRGVLHFYQGGRGRWRHRDSQLTQRLSPGGRLALVADPRSKIPIVYTINQRGELVEVLEGRRERIVAGRGEARFVRDSQLTVATIGGATVAIVVDDRGRVWELDLERGRHRMIERRPGFFEPGAPIKYIRSSTDQVFLVDRSGNLVLYELRSGAWDQPVRVARGFVSGGELACALAVPDGGNAAVTHLASVGSTGSLRLIHEQGRTWSDRRIGKALLTPGTPVALAQSGGRLSASAVRTDGQWIEWHDRGQNVWDQRVIGQGFPAGAPVVLDPSGPQSFAVDRTGRVIAGQLVGRQWQCVVCSPVFDRAPRLVRRAVTPNKPLEPVTITLVNRHRTDLVVRIIDVREPNRPIELKIPPGGSESQRIQRDSGATLEEVYLRPGPLGNLVEEVHRHRLPARNLYDVVVYENRVTSVFFDRTKNKGPTPDKVSKSLVSLGVFPLPAGERIREGDQLDVYREAASRRNPGAVRARESSSPTGR